MARLSSEDEQIKTSFDLIILKDKIKKKPAISWVPYELILQSHDKKLIYKKDNVGTGDYVFAVTPINEIENLSIGIKNFLKNQNKNLFSFEPMEPSFELILERSHKGYSATLWVDAGNVVSDHYTWDGFGLRFFTSKKNINSFTNELVEEAKDLISKNHA